MSNLLLRSLREAGVIQGEVLPFARANVAADLGKRLERAVMVLDGVNNGDYWVVEPGDAERLEAAGYVRYDNVADPTQHQAPDREQ